MATEQIISPGFFSQENDQTFISKRPANVGAAVVGPTVKGQPMIPVRVSTYNEYVSKFGNTFKSGSQYYQYLTSLTAEQYFNNGGESLWVVPIKSGSYSQFSTYSSASIPNSTPSSTGNYASTSFTVTNIMTGSNLFNKISMGPNTKFFIQIAPYYSALYYEPTFNILYVGTSGLTTLNSIASTISSAVQTSINGASFAQLFSASYSGSAVTLYSLQGGSLANSYSFTSSMQYADSSGTSSSFSGGTDPLYQNSSFTIETLNYGTLMNNTSSLLSSNALSSGSNENVRWEINNVNTSSGEFSLVVRSGNDTQVNKNILESWNNLSLDPIQPNYISKVIGDTKNQFYKDVSTGEMYIQESGSYPNNSQYIRVKTVNSIINDSIDNNGNFRTQYSGSLPIIGSGSFGGSFAGGIDGAGTKQPQYMYENITSTSTNSQGYVSSDYIDAISLISNKDEYDYNLLLLPGLTADNANLSGAVTSAISMVENRGDCFVIFDISSYGNTLNSVINNSSFSNSNYAGTYWPWVQVKDTNLSKNVWVPPSTVLGGVLAFNDSVSAPWHSPAGLNRGGLSQVIKVERKLSQSDRDALYNVNINPIATFPSQGINVFGQKTMQKKSSSLDRINVRRLLITIKRFINQNSRQLIFEQNTINTRNKFLSIVEPYLEQIVEKQGLHNYKINIGDDINTPDVIDRNELRIQLYIQPTRTIEFIILNVNLTPTGASIS